MADNADPAGELTMLLDDAIDITDYGAECSADDADGAPDPPAREPMSAVRRAMLLGLAMTVALAVLVGWLGFRALPVRATSRPSEVNFCRWPGRAR